MAFDGTGCAISQAAVSILTEIVPGMTVAEVKALGKEDILDELGITPTSSRLKCALPVGHSSCANTLICITPTSSRLKCALLGLKVLKIAVAGKQWHDDPDDM